MGTLGTIGAVIIGVIALLVIVAIVVFLVALFAPVLIGLIILAIIIGVGYWIYGKVRNRMKCKSSPSYPFLLEIIRIILLTPLSPLDVHLFDSLVL